MFPSQNLWPLLLQIFTGSFIFLSPKHQHQTSERKESFSVQLHSRPVCASTCASAHTDYLILLLLQIERIQNPGLYRQYMSRKLEMDKVNGHNPSNERRLWHGTSGSNISNISVRNFNRSYGGVHGM